MLNNKPTSRLAFLIVFFTLLTSLFIGAELSATEKDRQQATWEGNEKGLVNLVDDLVNSVKKKKEPVNEVTTFDPTEKVSADQAVAFPTDI